LFSALGVPGNGCLYHLGAEVEKLRWFKFFKFLYKFWLIGARVEILART